MKDLVLDLETFSSVDLARCGVYKYAASEDFEILLFAYSADSEFTNMPQVKILRFCFSLIRRTMDRYRWLIWPAERASPMRFWTLFKTQTLSSTRLTPVLSASACHSGWRKERYSPSIKMEFRPSWGLLDGTVT